jgi:hypothetical protein
VSPQFHNVYQYIGSRHCVNVLVRGRQPTITSPSESTCINMLAQDVAVNGGRVGARMGKLAGVVRSVSLRLRSKDTQKPLLMRGMKCCFFVGERT